MLKGKTRLGLLTLVLVSALGLIFSVPHVRADNVVQSFSSKTKLDMGTIVSLTGDASHSVEKVPAGRADLIFGVVVDAKLAPITLDQAGSTVFIASQGSYSVLVSDENGPLTTDDYISVSTSDGIGAKATGDQSIVLGKALKGFDGKSGVIGKAGSHNIGLISVNINITKNPSFKNTLAIPEPLQKIGNSIAGRETSPLKIYIALILFLISSVLTLIMLVVGTRGGLVAIGRNPLSKHTVLRALFQVVTAAVIIFIASLIGVYLLLRI